MNSTEVQNPRRKMQVALFAEPKTPLESSMSIIILYMSSGNELCWHFCTHHEALLLLHMRIECLRTREITSVVCGRNAEIAYKMADYRVWERYSYLRNEAIIRKTPN